MSTPRPRGHGVGESGSPHARRELSSSGLQSFLAWYVHLCDPWLRGRDAGYVASDEVRRCLFLAKAGPGRVGRGVWRPRAWRAARERRARGGAAPRRALPARAARAAGPRAPARSKRRARAVGAGPRRSARRRRWREAQRDEAAAPAPRSPSPRGAGELRAGKPRGRATSLARPRAGFAGGSSLGAFVSATRERRESRPPPQRAL